MDRVGRNIDDRARLGVYLLAVDGGAEDALQNVDPLLVGVRMRLGAGARGHPHQPDDHAVAFDAWPIRGRIIGPAHDLRHAAEVEQKFAGSGAFGAWRARSRWAGHGVVPCVLVLTDVS